ncbi:hypothetical protein [Streptacidiphilus sp. MAP5-3]|uniref:hypothetical protein n=1 Tax=unclassified Streptacidiphilus TaxID=2643834 RepID=UPI0035165427
MNGDQFFVGNEYLTDLAKEFQAASDNFASMTPTFQGNAIVDAEAFGLLGACTGAFSQYQGLVEHTVNGLNQMIQALAADAAGLANTADTYGQVEHYNKQLLGGN